MITERLLSSKAANHLIDLELKKLHLESKLHQVSHGNFNNYECQLINPHTYDLIEREFGKGNSAEAQLGAKFEALEHFTSIISRLDVAHYYCSLNDLQAQKQQVIESKVPQQILQEPKYQKKKLIWLQYCNYRDRQTFAHVPAASVAPFYLLNNKLPTDKFPYNEIYIQDSNNGVAIGTNTTEALIHAISELRVCRDARERFTPSLVQIDSHCATAN